MRAHQYNQPWWHEVAEVRIEPHPNRASAVAAERAAIRTEKPRYNIAESA
jgi:hypothetical protein